MQKQRKLKDMVKLQQTEMGIDASAAKNDDDYFMPDDAEEGGLEALMKLAGQEKEAEAADMQLDISDAGLPTDRDLALSENGKQEPQENASPKSVGAESSYSDFMQQWKSKLQKDEDNDANGPSDVVSNHSAARSNYSRRSNNPADDSPFRDISGAQTRKLLKNQNTEVIPE